MKEYRITVQGKLVATGVQLEYARFALVILAEAGVPAEFSDSDGETVAVVNNGGLLFAEDALVGE